MYSNLKLNQKVQAAADIR